MYKPTISLIIPAYNEESIIEHCMGEILRYVTSLKDKYDWEILLINDGSKDKTGELADKLAKESDIIRVIHHPINKNLGCAMRTGFANAKGEYIITYDLDLSYSPDHIGSLADTIISTQADLVLASPYMKGGKVTDVPFLRIIMSKWANRFMNFASKKKVFTYSGMVRAYRSDFIKNLNLKSTNYSINAEIIFKAQILRARIVEIPAHLDWSFQNKIKKSRISGIRIKDGILDGLMSGFIFRPYYFFLLFGGVLFLLFLYMFVWMGINISEKYATIVKNTNYFDDRFSIAVAAVFQDRPHAFLIAGIVLIISIVFLGIGLLSLQNKRYFDELFHINSTILKNSKNKDVC
ncbi:MAG TPA: glycosyltransferase family 2 protein [Bacteroidales bacterium]|nr:glycosyltransferase family 2 protein [Bacteroidales bacterium]